MQLSPSLSSDHFDSIHQGFDVSDRIHALSERHGSLVTYDFLDHRLVNVRLSQQRDTGVLDIYAIIRKMDLPKTRCITATLDK